ncbi:hypothetical protein [Thiomonas sp.]|uniref:hypothetical protein n=1 Tax=Thiomonas sp. TaxID=2047785 RepID=UPI00262A2FB4|nr:hypothetical protein [Thiomonas sp.]
MSRKAHVFVSPNRSPAHLALRLAARQAQQDEEALRDLLWLINAPDTLIGLARICENICAITAGLKTQWMPIAPEGLLDTVLRLEAPAQWVASSASELTSLSADLAAIVLTRASGLNPLLTSAASRHPLATALWHIAESPARRQRYRFLQAHLLVACVNETAQKLSSRAIYEEYEGKELLRAMPNSPYPASLAVRDWSRESDFGIWLEQLPVLDLTEEFVKAANLIRIENQDVVKRLRDLTTFLEKTTGQRKWILRKSSSHGGKGGNPLVTGYIEAGPGIFVDTLPLTDPQDTDMLWGDLNQVSDLQQSQQEQNALLDLDLDPEEDQDEDTLFLGSWLDKEDDTANPTVTTGQIRHVRLENQLLPWAYEGLGIEEIGNLLLVLSERGQAIPDGADLTGEQRDALETMALLETMLWTGSDLDRARGLQVITPRSRMADAPLVLEFDPNNAQPPAWIIRARVARRQQRQSHPDDLVRTDFLRLPIRWGSILCIRKWLKTLDWPPANSPEPLRTFTRRPLTYRDLVTDFLRQVVDPSQRVTAHKIGQTLFFALVHRGADIALTNSFLGPDDYRLARVRLFYSAPKVARVIDHYERACDALWAQAKYAMQRPMAPQRAQGSTATDFRHLRGRPMPGFHQVKTAIQTIKKRLRALDLVDQSSVIDYSNLYTLYTVWQFEFATGCRAIRTPYLAPNRVDVITGFASWADKDDGSDHKRRLIWVPPDILAHMHLHRQFWDRMHRSVPTLRGDSAPCRFFADSWQIQEVRPQTLLIHKKPFLDFGANMHRHFMREALLDRGAEQEIVDAFMGHWSFGEEPWHPLSSLSPQDYADAIAPLMTSILNEIGFEPIASRYP